MADRLANKWTLLAVLAALIYLVKKCDLFSGGFMALTTDTSTAGANGGFLDKNDATQTSSVSDPSPQDPPMHVVGLGTSGLPAVNPLTNNKFTAVRTAIDEMGTRMETRTNRNYDSRGPTNAEIAYYRKGQFDPPGGFLEDPRMTEAAMAKQQYLQYRNPDTASRSTISI